MVEPEFTLFQMQVEGMLVDPSEAHETNFGQSPEVLNAVDVRFPFHEFTESVTYSEVVFVPEIHESVVAPPGVGMDDGVQRDSTANHPLERLFLRIWDDLGVDMAIALEDPEDDRLPSGSSSAFAFDAPGTEVGFIDFHFSTVRGIPLAGCGDVLPNKLQISMHRVLVETRELHDFPCLQIEGEVPQELTKLGLRNS